MIRTTCIKNSISFRLGSVSSASFTNGGTAETTWKSTTSGALLQMGTEIRITAAAYGFPKHNEVYHPDPSGRRVGKVVEQYPQWDIALIKLNPSISSNNERYFEAPRPKRIVAAANLRAGDWFEADSMLTGSLDFCVRGVSEYHSF